MSRQDKTTTERHTKTLRELVKRPENKLCADCKRNDPRWASWNLGVFLCIRCSGIHRGMGTHISKVKSVDLDVWTPEQMESILKWGNRRANVYWEAHLKAGHVPPEHKMESFIRSKYESRRWAMEGPPPSDPSVLEDADESGQSIPAPDSAAIGNGTRQPPAVEAAVSSRHTRAAPAPSQASAASPILTTRQSQPHHLLSTSHTRTGSSSTATKLKPQSAVGHSVAAPTPPTAPLDELFSLDFHAPPSSSITAAREEPKKDVKQDILSLYSAPAPATAAFAPFGAPQQPQLQQFQPVTSMMGENGTGHWGVGSGWNNPAPAATQANVWGNPSAPPSQPSQSLGFAGNGNPWNSSPSVVSDVGRVPGGIGGADLWSTSPSLGTAPQKEDAFADLWK